MSPEDNHEYPYHTTDTSGTENQRLCPDCQQPLKIVRQTGEKLYNDDQFDAIKAGDYYCEKCPSNGRGNQPLKYWWAHEIDTSDLGDDGMQMGQIVMVGSECEYTNSGQHQVEDYCRQCGQPGGLVQLKREHADLAARNARAEQLLVRALDGDTDFVEGWGIVHRALSALRGEE